ncbi:MAG: T9SS C-terminal target domain-containing protein [Flavobacteriia bacterium]|nr:T9SS C-terminal target domain-containing protein [Flavobacteriia bacterium]NBV68715.1 T9SS C-terminal target domain-containing protein [Flavobacteriia bacterium]NBY41629.1 T9SS C-terminal target domain-containing protein [Flavobacteriia bacterium]
MKKILLSFVFGLSVVSLNAQIINGDFEQAATPAFPNVATTAPGWGTGLYTMETGTPYAGMQSAKLATIYNPNVAAIIGFPSDTIPGIMQQIVSGPVVNPANLTVTFAQKRALMAGDTAVVIVAIADTMAAGQMDDVILYEVDGFFSGTGAWTMQTMSVMPIPGAVGTPNAIFIQAISSGMNPKPGSTLWLDNFTMTTSGAGIDDLTNAVNVYPNPATDVLNFQVNEEVSSIELFGMDGKLAMTSTHNAMNISALPNGIYFYTVNTVSGKILTGKVSKI